MKRVSRQQSRSIQRQGKWRLAFTPRLEWLEARTVPAAIPFAGPETIASPFHASIIHVDIDRDGDLDIAAAGQISTGAGIYWYENTNGDGSAWTAREVSLDYNSAQILAEDVDGDGDIDLIGADTGTFLGTEDLYWFENTAGDGSAWSPHTIDGENGSSVAIGDIDGDGDLDIVGSDTISNYCVWFQNTNGDGSVWTEKNIALQTTYHVAVGDIDSDGDLDIATSLDDGGDEVRNWFRNDDGLGDAWTAQALPEIGVGTIVLADFDGDGDVDFFPSNTFDLIYGNTLAWFSNDDGLGTSWTIHGIVPAEAPTLRVVDVDSDGDLDVLTAFGLTAGIGWHENDGTGSIIASHFISGDDGFGLTVGDLDGDGDQDVAAVVFANPGLVWFRNDTIHRSAAWTFATTPNDTTYGWYSVASGDLDGDGDLDLLAQKQAFGSDDGLYWFEQTSPLTFEQQPVDTTYSDHPVGVFDVDEDGDLDIVTGGSGGVGSSLAWYENVNGDGSTWVRHLVEGSTLAAAVGDLDRDGDLDFVASVDSPLRVVWYENDGNEVFAERAITSSLALVTSLDVSDMDRDGDLDVVAGEPSATSFHVLRNDGGGTFTTVLGSGDTGNASVLAVVDVDSDGDADSVYFPLAAAGSITWYEQTTPLVFVQHIIHTTSFAIAAVVPGDVDLDGDMDFYATAVQYDPEPSVTNVQRITLLNDGNELFTAAIDVDQIETPPGGGAPAVTLGDVDSDGDLDAGIALGSYIIVGTNVGGQIGLTPTITAPQDIGEDTLNDVVRFDLFHRGRLGDHPVELASFSVQFFSGFVLDDAQANALFDEVQVYADTNDNDNWDFGSDTLIKTISTLTLTAGILTIALDDDTPGVQVPFGASKSIFVVLKMTADANDQDPNVFGFSVGPPPFLPTTGEDADADIPVVVEFFVVATKSDIETDGNTPPTANAGGPYIIAEGDSLVLDASASSDPDGDPLTFTWDVNFDGVFGDAIGETPTLTWVQLAALVPSISDGPFVLFVRVRVSDPFNPPVPAQEMLVVNNAAPTAELVNSGPVDEGEVATVTFINQADESPADLLAGFTYGYDFNNDGDFLDAGEADGLPIPSIGVSSIYLDDNPSRVIRGRITDKDGGFADYLTTITIFNVAPTAAMTNTGPVFEHNSASVFFTSQSDPSDADVSAGFHYAYDFNNDGIFEDGDGTYAGSGSASMKLVPATFLDDNPSQIIRGRIIDKDGAFTETTTTIIIINMGPVADFAVTGPLFEGRQLAATFSNQGDLSTADILAGFLYSIDLNNDGDFTDAGEILNSTSPTLSIVFANAGTYNIRGRIGDKDGGVSEDIVSVTIVNTDAYATGQDKGGEARIRYYDPAGVEQWTTLYHATFRGGVRVAVGDVNGDGVVDVIAAPGKGGKLADGTLNVRVFNGTDGAPLPGVLGTGFRPFGDAFNKGIHVASADVNGDGFSDIIVAPGTGMSPIVKVISGADGTTVLREITTGFPNSKPYKKGVRVTAGDVNGDTVPDIIAHAGMGASSLIRVFDGTTGNQLPGAVGSFNPFVGQANVKGGLFIAAGDVNGDGRADIIAASGKTSTLLRVFSGLDGSQLGETTADAAGYKGGIRVAAADLDGDGLLDVIIGTGKAKGLDPHLRVLKGNNLTQEIDAFFADPTDVFTGGVFVAGGR